MFRYRKGTQCQQEKFGIHKGSWQNATQQLKAINPFVNVTRKKML